MSNRYYVFLDWRPLSIPPVRPMGKQSEEGFSFISTTIDRNHKDYKDHKLFDIDAFGSRWPFYHELLSIETMNNGFFLFLFRIESVKPKSARTLRQFAEESAHKIKVDILKHNHIFHTKCSRPHTVLLEFPNVTSSNYDLVKEEMKKACANSNELAVIDAFNIESGFKGESEQKGLELFQAKINSSVENVLVDYSSPELKNTLTTGFGKFLTIITGFSLLSVTIYFIFNNILNHSPPLVFNISICILLFTSYISVYLRAIQNTERVKNLILNRGYADSCQLAVDLASKYINPKTNISTPDLSARIRQLVELEKEKGLKYKMQALLFATTIALFIAGFSLLQSISV